MSDMSIREAGLCAPITTQTVPSSTETGPTRCPAGSLTLLDGWSDDSIASRDPACCRGAQQVIFARPCAGPHPPSPQEVASRFCTGGFVKAEAVDRRVVQGDSSPFQHRDRVARGPAGWYAGGFAEKADGALWDFAARLRAGCDCIPQQFNNQVAEAINVPQAPSISAFLNTATHWRARLEQDMPHGQDFARSRVDDNERGYYGTPLRERLSRRSRYDRYNDALRRRLSRHEVHRVEVFDNVYSETSFARKFRCWRVRHIRYSRQQYESAMVALEKCLQAALTSDDTREVVRCAARIVYDVNNLTVTYRGQGAVAELMGLSLLAARGIPIPALVSGNQPIYLWAETALSTREQFIERFEHWLASGHWRFWYED